jgi:peptidoglycan/LPS O-acetylase OafA/YrhL
VVFHHFRIMALGEAKGPRWLTLFNPLTTGHEAVMLFFLLSGFVLSLPYLRGRGQGYPIYLLRRILRIYAPYLFALALAVGGAAIWHSGLDRSGWSHETWSEPVSGRLVLEHVLMIGNYNWEQFNTAFWSLVVEMRVSIVFPLLFLMVHRLRVRTALLLFLVISSAAVLGEQYAFASERSLDSVKYGAVFICGIVLAGNFERVSAWFRGVRGAWRWAFALVSFVIYCWGHHIASEVPRQFGLDLWLITLGAAGFMVLAINAQRVRVVLNSVVPRFLGRISYSLYLVHGTVLFALTYLLGSRLPVMAQLLVYVPASLLLAYLFCIVVEEPFLQVSRRVGKLARATQTTATAAAMAGPPA